MHRLTPILGGLVLVFGGLALRYFSTPEPADEPVGRSSASVDAELPASAYVLEGLIADVADGDSVTMDTGQGRRRIRLDSIDAPEAEHSASQPGQPFAEEARQSLADMLQGRKITAQCYEKDQYERDVCALILPDGRSANRAQVATGYAWAYTARRGEYLRDKVMPVLQQQAQQAGRGMWAQPADAPVAPWKWRYDCWKQGKCGARRP